MADVASRVATAHRAARVVLWGVAGYGVLGAVACVFAADLTGRGVMLRFGAALVLLAGLAGAGLWVTRDERMKA